MHKSTISRELKNYLKNSHLEINNNLVENDVRPFAVGRKNWLFAGSSRRLTVHTPIKAINRADKKNNRALFQSKQHRKLAINSLTAPMPNLLTLKSD